MWGLNGTARVLIEYTETANFKGVLLEPVDVKKDRYGLVYAPPEMGTGFIIPSETRLLTEDNPSVPKADQVHRSWSLLRKWNNHPLPSPRNAAARGP